MMNFLDLSAASEEERRHISEILSDTSVVNFAEPLRQQNSKYNQTWQQIQPEQVQQEQTNNTRQQQYQNHQPNHISIKTKTAQSSYQAAHHQQNHNQPHIPQNHTTNTTNNVSHDQRLNHVHTHNVPVTSDNHRHANHVQMPSHMAGDINPGVVSIDINTAQHAGYPIPHPTSAHVAQAYGPPPPHHMYGGPPIFQPYPFIIPYSNLVYGNMPPYSVLPATNSVVTQRQQQAPPHSSQPPSTLAATSSNSRSQSHHPRLIRAKDQSSKHNSSNHNQQLSNNVHHYQNNYKSNSIEVNDVDITSGDNDTDAHEANYKTAADNNQLQLSEKGLPPTVDGVADKSETRVNESAANQIQVDKDTKTNIDDDICKTAPIEALQSKDSSSVPLKQVNESSTESNVDKMNTSPVQNRCNGASVETSIHGSTETNNVEKTDNSLGDSENATKTDLWSSAASKSWASLFKGDGSLIGNSDGKPEQGNADLNNPEDDTKNLHRNVGSSDNNVAQDSKSNSSKMQRSQDASRRALDKTAPKLAQKISSITLKHSLPLLRPRGFINRGNGCYINSTLQALIACPPFYNLMKEIGDLKDLKRENSCTPILDNFAELFLNFPPLDASKKNKQISSPDQRMQISQLQADALEPKCIYDVLGQIKSECLRGAQEDAEEFLSSVLNGLHEEMIGLSEILQSNQCNNSNGQNGHISDADDIDGDSNNDENRWREVGSKNRSLPIRSATVVNTPIQEIFGGSLFSIRTAGKDRCGHYSPFFDLQLDISGDHVRSLQDAIKSFTATETIHDFYCSKTKQKLDAQRRTCLDQLPPILILHLKQFIYTQDHGLKKLMKRIDYPIDFELPDSCLRDKNSDKSLRNSRTYKLLAVVYHDGKEAVKGHYLTDVYHIGSSQWIRCDDSNLRVVPAPRIDNPDSTRTPYLLFYRRLNTLKPPHSSNSYNNHHDNNKKKS